MDVNGYITTKDSDFSSELKNILDEQFNPECPNAVWCSDITYIWTIDGFVYLTSIMDLYSRKIIAWTLSKTLEVSCVIETIKKAKAVYTDVKTAKEALGATSPHAAALWPMGAVGDKVR